MPVRVYHADDADDYRHLICEMLDISPDVEVVGGAGHADKVVEEVGELRPDVVLLDQLGGPELVQRIRDAAPDCKVLILSGYPEEAANQELAGAADGYIQKTNDVLGELEGIVVAAVAQ